MQKTLETLCGISDRYSKCEVYDSKRSKLFTILEKSVGGANYKIICDKKTLNFYVDYVSENEILSVLDEMKSIVEKYLMKISNATKNKFAISNLVFSKGYDVLNDKIVIDRENNKDYIIDDKVGLTVKFDDRGMVPIILHSYLLEDDNLTLDEVEMYIDRLYGAFRI